MSSTLDISQEFSGHLLQMSKNPSGFKLLQFQGCEWQITEQV